jgi:hypothetical protein
MNYVEEEDIYDKIPGKIKDYRLAPLKKFQRPYFSPRTGSYEMDYTIARHDNWSRWYFVCININMRYLMIYPLHFKFQGEAIKNTDVQSVQNTLSFIQRASQEIWDKFIQKLTNI